MENFEIYGASETLSNWIKELRENDGLIPSEIIGSKEVVFDGYTNPIEILSHSFVCKPVYLRLFRRRYKRAVTNKIISKLSVSEIRTWFY